MIVENKKPACWKYAKAANEIMYALISRTKFKITSNIIINAHVRQKNKFWFVKVKNNR